MDFNSVILVDETDREIGVMEKLEAHQKGVLHRAFSIFIFNSKGDMLLQKRATEKYHCGALWSNACCSHPSPNNPIHFCLEYKLMQEMGLSIPLEKAFDFTYKAQLDNGLVEHEYDHVYLGRFDGAPTPNPDEVSAWRYASMDDIKEELSQHPGHFTPWFRLLFEPLSAHYRQLQRA